MTGTFEGVELETYVSGANLNGQVYRLLKIDSTGDSVDICAAATDRPVGFLAHDPKRSQFDSTDTTGDVVTVGKIKGKIPLSCSAAITAGQFVQATTGGQIVAIANIGAAAADTFVIGQALETGATDQIITVDADLVYSAATA